MGKFLFSSERVQSTADSIKSKFKLTRSAIQELYRDDASIGRNVGNAPSASSSLGSLTIDALNSNYYNINNLDLLRQYSQEAYALYPIYSNLIDSLSNMFYWRYVFYPRLVKEKQENKKKYEEIYKHMAEIVDGLALETTMPQLLASLLTNGCLFLTTVKRTGSQTLTTMIMPNKRCRITGMTQFGTSIYQFDFAYFDDLGLNKEQLDLIFTYYPQEMRSMYDKYKQDSNLRWQKLNPKYSAAFVLNATGFPTYLRTLGAIMQYDSYRANELERSNQQLMKIIAHKMPTWEDKLVVEIPEMTELHKSMSKVLTKNKNVRMLTTFGDLQVLSIGDDQSKENKTLTNAYSSIYNVGGDNENLFSGNTKESLDFSLRRNESIIWKYVQEIMSFYNIAINTHYNFIPYQCSLNMLPLSVYNFAQNILQYKEGATLGTAKLEYIVSLGTKQVDIPSKIEVEDFLHLDELKPLSTSYTGAQNAAGMVPPQEEEQREEPVEEDENKSQQTTEVQNEEV